jgi:hypothetical protein
MGNLFHSIPVPFQVLVGGVIAVVIMFAIRLILKKINVWIDRRPIVCVCEVNGRVGVVLRKNYNKASKLFWRPYLQGKTPHYNNEHNALFEGRLISVKPIFVFKSGSREYRTLVSGCYVEKATFEVPFIEECELPVLELHIAHKHIYGRQWNGMLPVGQ